MFNKIQQYLDSEPNHFLVLRRIFSLSFTGLTTKNFSIPCILILCTFLSHWLNVFSRLLMRWGCSNQALFPCRTNNPEALLQPLVLTPFLFKPLWPYQLPPSLLSLNYHLHTKLQIPHPLHSSLYRGMGQWLQQIQLSSKFQWPFYNITLFLEQGHRCTCLNDADILTYMRSLGNNPYASLPWDPHIRRLFWYCLF